MIKAGYQLVINSWSNDGDNYKDITINGLMEQDVYRIIELCKLFTSDKFGNMYEGTDEEVAEASAAMVVVLNTWKCSENEIEHATVEAADYMTQYLGCDEYYTFRVFESFKVHYFPTDIEDVTGQFNDR